MSWPNGVGKLQPTPQTLALMDEAVAKSRNDVIEECAAICKRISINAERRAADHTNLDAKHAALDKSDGAQECEQAIRALVVSRPNCGGEA